MANDRAASAFGRSTTWRLPVQVCLSPERVGPRAVIRSAKASMYDQCASLSCAVSL